MSWAARRRFLILLIVGAVIVAFLATVLIATLYETPSCSDGIQNQGETGVDCGGSCAYLCLAEMRPPTVLFTKALRTSAGRTDVIASIENNNAHAAAKDVPYRITLYGANQSFVQEVTGTVDLPPRATQPIYVSGVATGKQRVESVFLEIASSSPRWFALAADPRVVPTVTRITGGGTASAPRIEAVLANPSATALSAVRAVIFVYDAHKSVIAASETIVPILSAQSEETAIFTWNEAFAGTPASIEVTPIIPLPDRQAGLP